MYYLFLHLVVISQVGTPLSQSHDKRIQVTLNFVGKSTTSNGFFPNQEYIHMKRCSEYSNQVKGIYYHTNKNIKTSKFFQHLKQIAFHSWIPVTFFSVNLATFLLICYFRVQGFWKLHWFYWGQMVDKADKHLKTTNSILNVYILWEL